MTTSTATSTSPELSTFPWLNASEIGDRLVIMRGQERLYQCGDYLNEEQQQALSELFPPRGPQEQHVKPVDEDCRVKMCEWCYQVVDFCKFRRETVSVGMSYLDRYVCTPTRRARLALVDRKEYQLAAMTALYMAIKLFEPMEMETSLVSDLSRGCYTEIEIAQMEVEILSALNWRVHGPTTLGFAHHLIALLPEPAAAHATVVSTLLDFTRFQTELAVGDYFFTTRPPSIVAVAAVLNSMEAIDTIIFSPRDRADFLQSIADAGSLNPFSPEVEAARQQLLKAFAKSSGYELSQLAGASSTVADANSQDIETDKAEAMEISREESPVCVSRRGI